MHHPIFGQSFAVLVALILLPWLVFYFLNKKKACERRNAEDVHTGAFGSTTAPIETNSDGSNPPSAETDNVAASSSSTETNNGASSSSTAPTGNCYEVFLSFRGLDTRNGFTDHLYNGLLEAGIDAFRDDDELCQGGDIRPDLMAAITNSKILIPILSVNYGASSWCLDELVQIIEHKNNNNGQTVLPIFYKVKPADVGHQIGSFGDAFHERERRLLKRRFDPMILEKWKQALLKVSTLKGYEADGSEAKLVKSIVRKVLSELKKNFELVISENLVGIDSHARNVMEFVDDKSHATLFVGIHGMGGIGKTTLAKIIYNKLSNQFEHHSFIADIRESWKHNGAHHLQNQFIYDILKRENEVHNEDEGTKFISSKFKGKKIIVLFDDVDNVIQLKRLAGKRDWFSSGSKIIITTRNERVLEEFGVDYAYDLKEMDKDQSLILFSKHAFRKDYPPREFRDLTNEVVSITRGLPLSLEVLGSLLCGKKLAFWRGTIDKLKKVPPKEVREKLRISYDALEYEQKQIFLDIACLFIGTDKRITSYMWEACRFFPEEGIDVLRFMSLIKIGDDYELRMHDQLRDLGREIVREENQREPQNRSRLWDSEEVQKVLKEKKGTEKIEAIYLSKGSSEGPGKTAKRDGAIHTEEEFKNMTSLRFLQVNGAHLCGDFKDSVEGLRWLRWPNCPVNFEVDNFHGTELVVLELSRSEINERWQGWSSFMMAEKLAFLDLSHCELLENTNFLSAFKNLEVLILNFCGGLQQIDSSIGDMKALLRLELCFCTSLTELPAEIGKLRALEQLLLQHTPALSALPDSIGRLQNLETLNISWSGIRELPSAIGRLRKLQHLDASHCGNMEGEMPESIGSLENLEILNISGTGVEELPSGVGRLRKLRDLDASYCENLKGEMPERSMRGLSCLQRLDFCGCKELQSLPDFPSSLTYLDVTCRSRKLPPLSCLTHLKELRVRDCEFLECIQEEMTDVERSELPQSNLEVLEIGDCPLIETLDVSQFNHLRTLSASSCDNIIEVRGLDKLIHLESLTIQACYLIERLDLPRSEGLKILGVQCCDNLVEIRGLNKLELLEKLKIASCTSIERLLLPKSGSLKILEAELCMNLAEIQGLHRLEFLEKLNICQCTSIEKLHLPKSERLKVLNVKSCEILVEIQDLNRLEFLEELSISECASIERLDLPKSGSVKQLDVSDCESLIEIQGLDRLEFLERLDLCWCASIESLPILCCFDTLRWLTIRCCDKFQDIRSLERIPSCETLWIEDCKSLAELPNLSSFPNLQKLLLSNCPELREIPGLEESISLKFIAISGCSSIEILPDLSSCTHLISLIVQNCEQLTGLRGLEKLEQLEELDISGCKSLKTIPELSGTRLYQNYEKKPSDLGRGSLEFDLPELSQMSQYTRDDLFSLI